MYVLPKPNYARRHYTGSYQRFPVQQPVVSHGERVKRQLISLGMSRLALKSAESRYLPHLIHPGEDVAGIVYGKAKEGFAMLIATNLRVIFLDKKPLFVNEDEITYDIVSGVSFSHAGLGSTVMLHTRTGDFVIRTFNKKCAIGFVKAIESHCIEQTRSNGTPL